MIFVYLFLGGVTLFLIVSALMPSKYSVKKTIVISKPVKEVMNKVGDLNHYASWNPWQQVEATATKTITGIPNTIGHKYSWIGKKTGEGSLTINEIDDRHIHFDLEFLKPWHSHAHDNWLFEETGNHETKITWHNTGELPWPMARMMGPLIHKNLNHQFQKGLNNLKEMCEA